jgi:hypothetical protein
MCSSTYCAKKQSEHMQPTSSQMPERSNVMIAPASANLRLRLRRDPSNTAIDLKF